MRLERWFPLSTAVVSLLVLAAAPTLAGPPGALGIGKPASDADLAAWNIDARADGTGLPPGRGSVAEGRAIFAETCAACHGDKGQGAAADALTGGRGTLASAKPLKTVGSFWPYATTLFDYVNRAMPFTAPQSLSPDQVYALSAYVLFLNDLVPETATLDAQSLAKVAMPNRNGFTSDPRPDVPPMARD